MDDEKAWIIFQIDDGILVELRCSPSVSTDLWYYLQDSPPARDDGTHIAAFVWDGGPPAGGLTNSMLGSTFTRFSFAKVRLLGVELVVGRYW